MSSERPDARRVAAGRFPGVTGWLRLSLRRGFASSRAVLATTLVGSLILTALVLPAATAVAAVRAQTEGSAASLNTISIYGDGAAEQPRLTTARRTEISAVDGVDAVTSLATASISATEGEPWLGQVHVLRPSLLPPGIDDETAARVTARAVIAPRVIEGVDLSRYVGTSMPVEYTLGTAENTGTGAETQVTLLAVYDPGWTGYGPNAILGSEEFVVWLQAQRYRKSVAEMQDVEGAPGVVVHVSSAKQVDTVMAQLRSMGFAPFKDSDQIGDLPGLLAIFPSLIVVVSVGLGLMLCFHAVSAVRNATARRTREFALLRMRGYRVRDVRALMVADIGFGAAVGALVGAVAGLPLGWLLALRLTPEELHLSWTSGTLVLAAAIGAGTVVVVTVVAAVTAAITTARLLRTDPFLLITREN